MPAPKSLRKALPTAKLLGTVASHLILFASTIPRFSTPWLRTRRNDNSRASNNPPISTTLPSSSPPPKKNDQKNPQGAIMTTRQTIAPPTPPNVKINSPISQKILSQNRTHFPTNPSHLVQNHPSPPNLHQLRQPRQPTDRRCRFIAHTADLSARTPSPPSSINRRCRLIVHPIDRAPD